MSDTDNLDALLARGVLTAEAHADAVKRLHEPTATATPPKASSGPLPRVLILLGVVLIVAGCVFGFTALNRDGSTCGSAFKPDHKTAATADFVNATVTGGPITAASDCGSATADRKTLSEVLLVPGGLLLFVGVLWILQSNATASTDTKPAT